MKTRSRLERRSWKCTVHYACTKSEHEDTFSCQIIIILIFKFWQKILFATLVSASVCYSNMKVRLKLVNIDYIWYKLKSVENCIKPILDLPSVLDKETLMTILFKKLSENLSLMVTKLGFRWTRLIDNLNKGTTISKKNVLKVISVSA